jgi:hypothetical protein
MNLKLLIIGLLFLFNPNINIVDILPDFIGCIIICAALEKSADVIVRLDDARKSFWKLSLVGITKCACILLLPYTRDEFALVLTFSFAIIELMYLIPAITALFDGFVYAGNRLDGTAVFKNADSNKYIFVMFVILKAVCSVLPEFTSLSIFDALGNVNSASIDIRHYKPAFIVLCFTVTFIFGVVWFVKAAKYVSGILKDKKFIDNLTHKYETEILPQTNLFLCRDMKMISTLIILGAIGTMDFYIDGINIFPNTIGVAFLIFLFAKLLKHTKKSFLGLALSGAYGLTSLAAFLLQIKYAEEYDLAALRWIPEAERLYYITSAVTIVQELLFGAVFILIVSVYTKLASDHIKILSPAHGIEQKESINHELVKELGIKMKIWRVTAILNAAASALYPVIVPVFGQIWLIQSALIVLFIIATVWVANEVNENVYNRYLTYS